MQLQLLLLISTSLAAPATKCVPSIPKQSKPSQSQSKATSGSNILPIGAMFTTGPCQQDADCASSCCERKANTCRQLDALQESVQSCKDGRTTDYSGDVGLARNIDTGKTLGPLEKFMPPLELTLEIERKVDQLKMTGIPFSEVQSIIASQYPPIVVS